MRGATQSESAHPGSSARRVALRFLFFAFLVAACFAVYGGSLSAPFLGDDFPMIVANPYVRSPGPNLLSEVFDPAGTPRYHTGGNYAPLQHLAHAIEWSFFGPDTRGYRVVSVSLHLLNVVLLVMLLRASGIAEGAALIAGGLFALHPANVESVNYISGLRGMLAMNFALGALVAFRNRPYLSAPLFGAALLCKAPAAFALPMAGALCWCWYRQGQIVTHRARAFGLWIVLLAGFLTIHLGPYMTHGVGTGQPYADLATHVRSVTAIGARYLAMSAVGNGTSSYHQPNPVTSNLDPWWLAGIVLTPFLVWRTCSTLWRGREEAAWWLLAAAGFAPTQFFRFIFGMADRYIYFILPGLLGAVILAGMELRERTVGWRQDHPAAESGLRWLRRGGVVAFAIMIVVFGFQARQRAGLWMDARLLLYDSHAHYPDGMFAHRMAAEEAIAEQDFERAILELREFADRGGNFADPYFYRDPAIRPLLSYPPFEAFRRELAQRELDYFSAQGGTHPAIIIPIAMRKAYLGEIDEAIEMLERSIRETTPLHGPAIEALAILEKQRADERRRSREIGPDTSK